MKSRKRGRSESSLKPVMPAKTAVSLNQTPANACNVGCLGHHVKSAAAPAGKARPPAGPESIIASRSILIFFATCERKHLHAMSISSRQINPQ